MAAPSVGVSPRAVRIGPDSAPLGTPGGCSLSEQIEDYDVVFVFPDWSASFSSRVSPAHSTDLADVFVCGQVFQ
jgi:hypothetical protein